MSSKLANTATAHDDGADDDDCVWLEYTAIRVEKTADGMYRATQDGVDITGRGANPGRAVAHYGECVAEAVYEGEDADETDEDA